MKQYSYLYPIWLVTLLAMVFAMVIIGAITRLTDSGLSIVEWLPLKGAIPPLNAEQWQEYFAYYQQSPQFIYRNSHFSLAEFQQIFWWEFIHRLWGRFIGLVFTVGIIGHYFWRFIPKKHYYPVTILAVLGFLQAVIGWWMVKSGLINRTEVSQYRLAVHLGLALIILGFIWVLLLQYWQYQFHGHHRYFALVIFLMILSGALVAGLRAGYIHQNFPFMGDSFFPQDYFVFASLWQNWGENPAAAQFNHRILAMIILLWALLLAFRISGIYFSILLLLVIQILLGITTLLSNMNIIVATVHQANAMLILLAVIYSNFSKLPIQD